MKATNYNYSLWQLLPSHDIAMILQKSKFTWIKNDGSMLNHSNLSDLRLASLHSLCTIQSAKCHRTDAMKNIVKAVAPSSTYQYWQRCVVCHLRCCTVKHLIVLTILFCSTALPSTYILFRLLWGEKHPGVYFKSHLFQKFKSSDLRPWSNWWYPINYQS